MNQAMRYPGATWAPGPLGNVGYDSTFAHDKTGVVDHSAGGNWSSTYRPTDTMRARGVSWHFSVFKDGHVEQHYEWDAVCYHAGNRPMNLEKIGVEHEGGPPGNETEPLTEVQAESSVKLNRWLSEQAGFPMVRQAHLHEHNEVVLIFSPNAGSTSCPSGRIPWERYTEEEEMQFTEDQAAAILGVVQWREDVVPVIDGVLEAIRKLSEGEDLDDAEVADLKSRLEAISAAAGGGS